MIPSILLGGEEHLVIRRKIKRAVRGEFGEGIVGCVSTMPNFFSIAGRGVCNPDRPRRHADWNEWKLLLQTDRKSTRLNSSHSQISYAVFCLKKQRPSCTTPIVA